MAFFAPKSSKKTDKHRLVDLKQDMVDSIHTKLLMIQSRVIMVEARHSDDEQVYRDKLKQLLKELEEANESLKKFSGHGDYDSRIVIMNHLKLQVVYHECRILYIETHQILTQAIARSNDPDAKADAPDTVREEIEANKTKIKEYEEQIKKIKDDILDDYYILQEYEESASNKAASNKPGAT